MLLLWEEEAKPESACWEPVVISRDVCMGVEIREQSGLQCGGRKVLAFSLPSPAKSLHEVGGPHRCWSEGLITRTMIRSRVCETAERVACVSNGKRRGGQEAVQVSVDK